MLSTLRPLTNVSSFWNFLETQLLRAFPMTEEYVRKEAGQKQFWTEISHSQFSPAHKSRSSFSLRYERRHSNATVHHNVHSYTANTVRVCAQPPKVAFRVRAMCSVRMDIDQEFEKWEEVITYTYASYLNYYEAGDRATQQLPNVEVGNFSRKIFSIRLRKKGPAR
jgi:hypothetical protein